MKQFCSRCGKSFRNRQVRIECSSCDIERYNKGLKTKKKKNMFKLQDEPIKAPEQESETGTEEEKEETTEEEKEETTE